MSKTSLSEKSSFRVNVSDSLGFRDLDGEPLLDLPKDGAILIAGNKSDYQSISFEAACTSRPVQISVSRIRHVEVDDEVHALEVDAALEDIRADDHADVLALESPIQFFSDTVRHPAYEGTVFNAF